MTQEALNPCEACAIGKASQQNLESHHSNLSEIGKQWYIDSMQLKKMQQIKRSFPSNNYFVMLTDRNYTGTLKQGLLDPDRPTALVDHREQVALLLSILTPGCI